MRKIPDATPEIITRYAFGDEQGLLAKIRYNRLVDIFLGIATYSLQNHLRTTIPNYGQIEIDELYVGVDMLGAQYVVPVQAKGSKDTLGVIQTIQDTVFCQTEPRYAHSIARPVSAQFMTDDCSGEALPAYRSVSDFRQRSKIISQINSINYCPLLVVGDLDGGIATVGVLFYPDI